MKAGQAIELLESCVELVRGIHNIRASHGRSPSGQLGTVLTIGAFDGLHRGHQSVLNHLKYRAAEVGLPSVVVTLEPLPREYFAPLDAPPRLMSFREKFEAMADLVEEMVCAVAEKFCGGLNIETKDDEGKVLKTIDLSRPWKRAPYRELIIEVAGNDWFEISDKQRREKCKNLGVEISDLMEDYEVTQQVFEKLVEEKTFDPLYVTHVPKELVPLAKQNADDDSLVDVYELIINGQEISPGYSELNDPDIQRKRLLDQAGEETQKVDEEFLMALEHGMPPAGGIGIGIDRLVMMLTGADSIRDVVLFPQLKKNTDED